VWEKIFAQKVARNLSSKFGEIQAKIFHTPKICHAPTSMYSTKSTSVSENLLIFHYILTKCLCGQMKMA